MPPVGLEPTISAGERPQTHVLDSAATGTGLLVNIAPCFVFYSVYLQTKHWRQWYLIWIRWNCPNSYVWQFFLHNDPVHIALRFISDFSVCQCMTLISFTLDDSVIIQITSFQTSLIHFDGSPKHSPTRGGQYVGTASWRDLQTITAGLILDVRDLPNRG
jgi:hypothetical protein